MTYLAVRNWDRYQHYSDRRPIWIKFYVELLDEPDIRRLPIATRLLWDQLLLLAARHENRILFDAKEISNDTRIPVKEVSRGLEQLLKGRWIKEANTPKRASKTLATRYQDASPHARPRTRREREVEKEPPQPPHRGGGVNGYAHGLTKRQLATYTGCRSTRGTHASGYTHDVLGTDKPPPDWPHPKPEASQIQEALTRLENE